ncbi:ABC transporter substrate-binding protein [Labrys monachus]|uniref:Branched-chain amino acid transport system substrate-binding protein n=1 Tax=Labrys monachus TaxID=217067 RepID=A0ABU0F9K4_9HYPH|nr:ABC transporter substrate-binding protein [Labrys monachus]MDQ0391300.1 branched-chain amino acid transport system substrate-binding protein [Labrys monachus]
MTINFKQMTRREMFRASGAAGTMLLSTALGGRMAHAAVDTSNFAKDGKISIGTILPLSGGFTVVSQPWIHSIQYAIDEINAAGGVKVGGTSYEVTNVVGDEMYSAAGGLSAFKKMAADGVHYTAGYVSVEAPAAVQGINVRNNAMMIEGITGKDMCLTRNALRFFEFALAQATAPYLAHYAYDVLKVRKVASIELTNTWGTDFHLSFAKTFQQMGGQIVHRAYLEASQTDFSAQISQMVASQTELLYIIMGDGPASAVALQARNGGLPSIPLMAEGAWGPETFQEAGGAQNVDGTVYQGSRPYVMWDDKHTQLVNKLHADTGLWLNNWFWHGYDPTKIVCWAMEEANSLDPREVMKAIPTVATKRASELMIRPQGAIMTKDKGVFLKIPLWLSRFNAKADPMKESNLVPVEGAMYRGHPGWMPQNWAGYTADPKDDSVNWNPTLDEVNQMRKEAGESVTPVEL